MKKFKLFKSYSEEERWLSEQSNLGWELIKKRVFYTFRKNSQQFLVYRVDYRTFKNKEYYQDYLNLFNDAGWKHVAGNQKSGEQYFCAYPQKEEDLSIFSDRKSSQFRYRKKMIRCLQRILAIVLYMAYASWQGIFDFGMILHPSKAFLTPGIWEKSGEVFRNAFLFELPFALIFRILPFALIIGYVTILIILVLWSINGAKKERGSDYEE